MKQQKIVKGARLFSGENPLSRKSVIEFFLWKNSNLAHLWLKYFLYNLIFS